MIKYYKMGIIKNDKKSMYKFGKYYRDIKDFNNMIKYYQMSIRNGNKFCIDKLAEYYKNINNYTELLILFVRFPDICNLIKTIEFCLENDKCNVNKITLMGLIHDIDFKNNKISDTLMLLKKNSLENRCK